MDIEVQVTTKADLKKLKKDEEFLVKMLRNLEIISRKDETQKEKEKAASIKAAKQLDKERKNSKNKITSFFKPKSVLAKEQVEVEVTMEVDSYDWRTLDRIQESWVRASRLKRAAFQRKVFVRSEQERQSRRQEITAWVEDIILDRWWKAQSAPTSLMKRDLKDLVRELLEIGRKLDQSCRTTEAALAKGSCFSNWRKLS